MTHAIPRGLLFILLCSLLSFCVRAQEAAEIKVEEQSFHFGTIAEEKGNVDHVFVIENSGKQPLVITRVSSDCGCTTPTWPKEAIEPGAKAELRVSYDPIGRPGAFRRVVRVFSNAGVEPLELIIEGTVSSLGSSPRERFSQSVGELLLSDTELSFPISQLTSESVLRLQVKNPTQKAQKLRVLKLPSFVRTDKANVELEADELKDLYLILSGSKQLKPGMHSEKLLLEATNAKGEKELQEVQINLPLVDNFDTLAASEQGSLSMSSFVNLGKIDQTRPRKLELELNNKGEGTLHIHSVTVSNIAARVQLPKEKIEAGQSVPLSLIIDPAIIINQGWKSVSIDVSIICSDPMAPQRFIKVRASI